MTDLDALFAKIDDRINNPHDFKGIEDDCSICGEGYAYYLHEEWRQDKDKKWRLKMKEFTPDEANEIRWDEDPDRPLVAIQDVKEHRWYMEQLVVYRELAEDMKNGTPPPGTLRGFYYLKPLSESQDGQDEYESDVVKSFPVVGKAVSVIVYSEVKA